MVVSRPRCKGVREDGGACQAAPRGDSQYCLWHDPERREEAAEARKLGGQRRRKERIVAGAYDFEGLGIVEDIRRLVEVAAVDTLGLENSVARSRTLAYLAQTARQLLETGEIEERQAAVESVIERRKKAAGRR
jgi:hypothetical protein